MSPNPPARKIGCKPVRGDDIRYESPRSSRMYWSGTPMLPESRCASAEIGSYTDKRVVTTSRTLAKTVASSDTKCFVSENLAMPVARAMIRSLCSSMSNCTEARGCITE